MDDIKSTLIEAFPSLNKQAFTDEYIFNNQDLLWDEIDIPLIEAVPLYMMYCINHASDESESVFGNTISALNKYARAKSSDIKWQNFKYECSPEQTRAVLNFLHWCESNLLLDYEPVLQRAIKNWKHVL